MMRESIRRVGPVRVPVNMQTSRGWQRGAQWSAEVYHPDRGGASWFMATGKSEPDAKAALSALIVESLRRADERPVLVIGGAAPDYADSMHLVVPAVRGYDTHVIRDGRCAAMWSGSDATLDEAVAHVLAHVGGAPEVVRL